MCDILPTTRLINLISVQRGFRANEVPFFRIPANGIRRSAYLIEEQGDSLKSRLRTATYLFFAFRRVNENMPAVIFLPLPSNFFRSKNGVSRDLLSKSIPFRSNRETPQMLRRRKRARTRFRKSGVRSFVRRIT